MDEKCNHTNAKILKKKHASDNKTKIDDTMLSFTSSILPAAEGCHPNITIGPRSNKMDRFNSYNPLQIERGTVSNQDDIKNDGDDEEDGDDEDEDEDRDVDDDKLDAKKARYEIGVDEDGTRRYTTADGKKEISYRKNAPQNGKY